VADEYIFPAEAKNVTEEFVRVGTRLGLRRNASRGTTTYCDMYYFEDAIAMRPRKPECAGCWAKRFIDFPVADNKTKRRSDGLRRALRQEVARQ